MAGAGEGFQVQIGQWLDKMGQQRQTHTLQGRSLDEIGLTEPSFGASAY